MLQAEQRIRLNLRWTGGMQLKAVWHPFPAGLIVRLMSQKLGQGGNEIQVPEPSSVGPRQAGYSELLIFSQPCGESTDHCRKSRGGPDQLRHIVMKPSHTLEIELGARSDIRSECSVLSGLPLSSHCEKVNRSQHAFT